MIRITADWDSLYKQLLTFIVRFVQFVCISLPKPVQATQSSDCSHYFPKYSVRELGSGILGHTY